MSISGHSILVASTITPANTLELASNTGPFGIFTRTFEPPIPVFDEEYADSPDSEGAKRTRSRPQDPVGKGSLRIVGADKGTFKVAVAQVEEMFEEIRRAKGTLAWTPPDGTQVTYDLESFRFTGMPADIGMSMWRAEPEYEFTSLPYGRLAPVWMADASNLLAPIVDPSFESGLAGWSTLNGGAQLFTVADAWYGTHSMQITTSNGVVNSGTGTNASAAVTVNNTYTAAAMIKAVPGQEGKLVRIRLEERTAADAVVNSTTFDQVLTDEFVQISVTRAFGATGAKARIYIESADAGSSKVFYVDGVQIKQEATASPFSTTTANSGAALTRVDLPPIPGSVDALVRLILRDGSGNARNHWEWGLGATSDFPAGGEQLLAATLTLTGTTVLAARAGSVSANPARTTLGNLPASCGKSAVLAHVGPIHPKVRVQGNGTGPIYVRLAYRIQGGAWSRTPYQSIPANKLGTWREVDFKKVIKVPLAFAGAQSLELQAEAYSSNAGDTLDLDIYEILPALRFGKARSPADGGDISTPTAWDDFVQAAGVLVGKAARVGGAWATMAGMSGTDFSVTGAAAFAAIRTATADGNISTGNAGRFDYPSGVANVGVCTLQCDLPISIATTAGLSALQGIGKMVSTSTWFVAVLDRGTVTAGPLTLRIYERNAAGAVAQLASVVLPASIISVSGQPQQPRMKLDIPDLYGNWRVKVWMSNTNEPAAWTLDSSVVGGLSGGAAYALSRVGIYDVWQSALVGTRAWENFTVWVPTITPITGANGDLEIRHNVALRASNGAKVPYEGGYLRIPPGGPSNRSYTILGKGRRNDIDLLPDDQVADNAQLLVQATPRVLLTSR